MNNNALYIAISITCVSILAVTLYLCLNFNVPEKKPIKINVPSIKKVGESTGKATTDFGIGFFKGVYKSIRGK